jgi:lipid II:glycine glycyltransferase (peptidoglycan interpeptide bridge formation enzyme)
MTKFEQDLFQKTMVYLNYRYRTTRKNLEQYINMREIAIINATDAGESEDLKKIIQKHNTEKRKFEILKLMLKATNFNELMPFYELYKQTLK